MTGQIFCVPTGGLASASAAATAAVERTGVAGFELLSTLSLPRLPASAPTSIVSPFGVVPSNSPPSLDSRVRIVPYK
jgi:hypothetical protein